jgi:hypothetical protein
VGALLGAALRSGRMRPLVAVAAALVLAPAGAATTSSGLWGVVERGPITPVCVIGTPCSAPARNVTLVFVRGGREIRRATTDRRGRYRVRLAPALYSVRLVHAPRVGRGLEPARARVRAGRFVRVDFFIDTGIRS